MKKMFLFVILILILCGCSNDDDIIQTDTTNSTEMIIPSSTNSFSQPSTTSTQTLPENIENQTGVTNGGEFPDDGTIWIPC